MFIYQAVILGILTLIGGMVWVNHRSYRRVWSPAQGARPSLPARSPLVSILVPARNEAENITECLRGLLRQDYPCFEVVVLDDGSTDETAALAEREIRRWEEEGGAEAGLRTAHVVSGSGLAPGWAGKAHACWELAGHARGEWLLFVDADTRHRPDLLSLAIAEAERTGADLLSTFPRQEIRRDQVARRGAGIYGQ